MWLRGISTQNVWIIHKKCGGNMQQFEFKEYLPQVYLYRLQNQRKRNLDDVRLDGVNHYLIEF